MKSLLLFIAAFSIVFSVKSQDAKITIDELVKDKSVAADTSKKGNWKFGGLFALKLTQQNSSNWIGVSEKFALNVGISTDAYFNGAWGKNTLDNTFKASYGYQNNSSDGLRKNADFFDFFSKYGYKLNTKKTWAAAAIINLRSQFTSGFDYDSDPRRRVSGFFAPAYALFTPGLDWRPVSYFSLFFSPVAARWVIVSNDPFSYSYPGGAIPGGGQQTPISETFGVNPYRKVDTQFGAFVSANFNKEILKNVIYNSRLDLLSNYLRNPENIDIFWTNTLAFKVNNLLTLSYIWNIAYDDDFVAKGETGPAIQFLGTFGIGVSAKF